MGRLKGTSETTEARSQSCLELKEDTSKNHTVRNPARILAKSMKAMNRAIKVKVMILIIATRRRVISKKTILSKVIMNPLKSTDKIRRENIKRDNVIHSCFLNH
ncbi:hypothetical protein XENTR_v10018384 [Xenopus tropicalis]|nr:hypothetical protein XENTR_v10018384 [Xenopus tropicalis]